MDWENECRAIRNRGPMIDRYTWDEADIKVKSLVYLSVGTEASRIYQQRNPHTLIDRCSTNELIYNLGKTFTRARNITFDRFQLITVQKNSNENLESFFSTLRELGSKAALGNVKEDLIKRLLYRENEQLRNPDGAALRGSHMCSGVELWPLTGERPGKSKRDPTR